MSRNIYIHTLLMFTAVIVSTESLFCQQVFKHTIYCSHLKYYSWQSVFVHNYVSHSEKPLHGIIALTCVLSSTLWDVVSCLPIKTALGIMQ